MLAVIIIAMLGTYKAFKRLKSFRKSSRSVYFSRKETPQLLSYSQKVLWHKTFSEALGKKDTKNIFSIKHHHVSLAPDIPPQTPPHSNVRNVAKIKKASTWTQSSMIKQLRALTLGCGFKYQQCHLLLETRAPTSHRPFEEPDLFLSAGKNTQASTWQRADA